MYSHMTRSPLASGLDEQITALLARDIGGSQLSAPVSGFFKRTVSGPFVSCILHQRSSTVMQIDASHSLRHGAFHKPIFDLKHTTVTLHAFSKAEARNDDSDDSLYKMTICAY